MRRFRQWLIIVLAVAAFARLTLAQEGEALDLPADLYVLINDGAIFRYGVGASGVTQITPAGEFAADFGVDDTGVRLAYRTENGLYTVDLTAPDAVPVQIEAATAGLPAYRGGKQTIAFSPTAAEVPGGVIAYTTLDGMRFAFLTEGGAPIFQALTDGVVSDLSWSPTGRYLAAETADNVWFIYRREAVQMALTSIIVSSFGTTWVSPTEIVFAPSDGGLKIMNLDAANQQTDLLDPSVEYRYPYLTADDNLDFFARSKNDTTVPEGYGILLRLARGAQVVATVGGTPIELTDLRWVPGGSLMTAFQAGVLAVFDPSSGFGYPLPIENVVAYDWGPLVPPELRAPPPDPNAVTTPEVVSTLPAPNTTPQPLGTAVGMNLPAAVFFIAQDGFGIAQVWRLPADNRPPVRLTFSDTDVSEYTIAFDGRTVYYVSDGTLWVQRPDIGFPLSLTDLSSFAPASPALNADATQLAYKDDQDGVNVITLDAANPASSTVQRTISNGVADGVTRAYSQPRWSLQGDRVLVGVAIQPDNGFALGVYDFAAAQVYVTQAFSADDPRTANARWLADGRIVAHVDANTPAIPPGYYVYDFIGTGAEPVLSAPLPPDRALRADVELSGGVLRALLASIADPSAAWEVVEIPLNGGAARVITTVDAVLGAPQFSRDGRYIVGYQRADGVLDRGALTLFDTASGQFTLINSVDGLAGEVWNVRF